MPLVIELATARLHVLSVEQISTLLDDRFRLLTGGSRAALPRQRTLRATVDWSYDLLGEAERTLFDRLSVFAGGWTMEAAEAICAGSSVAPDRILDLMAGLVDQSLVLAEAGEGSTVRYRLLETLRQYGRERLVRRGEGEPVRRRHAAYYLALAERAEPELTGPRQVTWLDRLGREHDNLRAALRWSVEGGELEIAARLCGMLGAFWFVRGRLREGTMWLDAVLPAGSSLPEPVRAKVLMWAGALRFLQRDYAQARAELEESLELWQALADRYWMAGVLNILGSTFLTQGDLDQAALLYERGLAAAQDAGDTGLIGLSLYSLGKLALNQGDYTRAATLSEESLALFRQVGDLRRVSMSLMNLARVAVHRTNFERALALYQEGLEIAKAVEAESKTAEGLEGIASICCARGQPVRATWLLGAAETVRDAIGVPVSTDYRAVYEYSLETVRASLDGERFTAAWAEGRAMMPEQAIRYALADEQSTLRELTAPGEQVPILTARQRQVAALVARGLTNREIAAELVIAEGTAANHVGHILSKLGLRSRAQLAAWAVDQKLSLTDPYIHRVHPLLASTECAWPT
jgi:non-specific serine/threonine protein kinase